MARPEPLRVDTILMPQRRRRFHKTTASHVGTAVVVQRPSTISHLRLLSVAKVAVVFWTCVGALLVGSLFATWSILSATGTISRAQQSIEDMTGLEDFTFMSGPILTAVVVLGALFVLVAVTLSVVFAAFYNAISHIVGGVDVTLRERIDPPAAELQQVDGVRSNGHADGSSVSKS